MALQIMPELSDDAPTPFALRGTRLLSHSPSTFGTPQPLAQMSKQPSEKLPTESDLSTDSSIR